MRLGGLDLDPSLQAATGYDSAPNGAANGSAMLQTMPSLSVLDAQLGLGAYAAGNLQSYPQSPRQDVSDAVLALGERAALPRETITVAAAFAKAEETGFSLTTVALARPVAFTLADVRADDRISLGLFNLVPEVSASDYRFNGAPLQDRADYREGLTTEYAPGGPGRLLLFLHATQSRYRVPVFNADTNEVLAGLQEKQEGVWTLRLLAGLARRGGAAASGAVTAPVVEASADWVPDELDHVSLRLAREIDDPDEISAHPLHADPGAAGAWRMNICATSSST